MGGPRDLDGWGWRLRWVAAARDLDGPGDLDGWGLEI